jgi:hypothetical protein
MVEMLRDVRSLLLCSQASRVRVIVAGANIDLNIDLKVGLNIDAYVACTALHCVTFILFSSAAPVGCT